DRRELHCAEAERSCAPHHGACEKLEDHRWRRAKSIRKLRHQFAPHSMAPTRQNGKRLPVVCGRERVKLCNELCDCLLPGNLLEFRVAAPAGALERVANAIGVVCDLEGSLASRAQLPLADRM